MSQVRANTKIGNPIQCKPLTSVGECVYRKITSLIKMLSNYNDIFICNNTSNTVTHVQLNYIGNTQTSLKCETPT